MIDKDVLGAIVLVTLLIVQQYLNRKTGKNDANRIERENAILAKQTSETVSRCSNETKIVMAAISEHMAKNDVKHISNKIDKSLSVLEKMADNQNVCITALDRMGSLVRSIADDIQQTNSQLVHERIEGKLHYMEDIIKDVKRIVISK